MFKLRSVDKMSYEKIGKKFGVSIQTAERRIIEYINNNKIDKSEIDIRYKFDKYYFYDIDTSEKAYWLGFITADGYINESSSILGFHIGDKDREHLYKFREAIHAEEIPLGTAIHSITGNKIATFDVCGKEFVNGLKKQGVEGNKSTKEKPPKIEEKYYPDFIRGLWDGDGHISDKKIGLCSSYEMCRWVYKQLNKFCGTPVNKIFYDSHIYRIYVSKTQIDVLKWMYYSGCKQIALDRKYKAAKLKILRSLKKIKRKNINDQNTK